MRLRIVNDKGLELQLPDDAVVTIDRINTLFNSSGDFIENVGQEFTVPQTENNKLFMGLSHMEETPINEYDISVSAFLDNLPISKGNAHVRVEARDFVLNLESNYTSLYRLLNNIRWTEIRSMDVFTVNTPASMAALMLDTAQNPDKYPYIFFPLYNPGMSAAAPGNRYDYVNYFDRSAQAFKPIGPSGDLTSDGFVFVNAPFYKLSYILGELFNYLGFSIAGNFITDLDTKNICVYTRQGVLSYEANLTPPVVYQSYRSMRYLPNMTIPDGLKALRERLHLAVDPDTTTGVATVESLATILRSSEIIDISKYLIAGVEQELPESAGSTVTLKSDEQDANFKVTSGDDETYPPIYKLVAGDGSTDIELDCNTTKVVDESTTGTIGQRYCSVNQSFISSRAWLPRLVNGRWWLGLPDDINPTDNEDPTSVNNWPLRLVKYLGWTAMTAGGHFPCSEPYDLNEDDELFYRFMNDSKKLTIPAEVPPAALVKMKPTMKYCYKSEGGNYVYFLVEKISYDLKTDTDLIPVKFYGRLINFNVNTRVAIQPVATAVTSPYTVGRVKAYFDNSVKGIDQLNIQVVATGTGVGHNYYNVAPVIAPTTLKGTGGVAVPIILDTTTGSPDINKLTAEIRITQGNPKFLEFSGIKRNFTWSGTYWSVPIDMNNDDLGYQLDVYWISF